MKRTRMMPLEAKPIIFRAVAVLLPLGILFGVAELVLRRAAGAERRRNEEAWAEIYAAHPPLQRGLARLMDLLKASEHPRVIYELRPDLSVQFRGAQVTVNSLGFRGPAFSADAAGVFRIVALGDSSLFGWGVNDDETYLQRLTGLLNEDRPSVRWEALNTGVPGYNTVMEVATLTNRCLQYKPDLVLIHHVVNDPGLPHFLTVQGGRKRPLDSHFLDWIMNRGRRVSGASDGLYMRNPRDIPDEYRGMIGEDACKAALRELKRLSLEHNFHLLICTDRWAPGYLKAVARDVGAPLIELGSPSARYMNEKGLRDPVSAGVTLDEHDNHYTAFGHELIAQYLLGILKADAEVARRVEDKSRERSRH